MKFLIYNFKSRKVGYGHHKRSLIIKNLFNEINLKSKVFSFDLKQNSIKKFFHYFNSNYIKKNYVILDISNKFIFEKKNFLFMLKKELIKIKNQVVIIDSLNHDSIYKRVNIKDLFYLYPYFVNKDKFIKKNIITKYLLIGPKYYFFDKKFKLFNKRRNKKIKKILITFGGSDLFNSSTKFIKLITSKFKRIKINVVVGPYFSNKQIKIIKDLKNNKNLTILNFRENIVPLINNTDMVITSTGLTKYELCMSNIPVVVFAANNKNYLVHKSFAQRNLTTNLSYKDSEIKIFNTLNGLINNKNIYKTIKNRKKYFDYNAPQRIVKILNKNV